MHYGKGHEQQRNGYPSKYSTTQDVHLVIKLLLLLDPVKGSTKMMIRSFRNLHSCGPLSIFLVYAFPIYHLPLNKTPLLLSNLCELFSSCLNKTLRTWKHLTQVLATSRSLTST